MGTSLNTGNPNDDDAQIMDSLMESHAAPPDPKHQPQTPTKPNTVPKPITRLLTQSQTLQPAWGAVLLLPADPNRASIQVWAASATPTDYARLSDDAGKLQNPSSCALLYSGQLLTFPLTAPGAHTGPVWVSCPDAVTPVTVSCIAVTS